jgi:hypothetical protein
MYSAAICELKWSRNTLEAIRYGTPRIYGYLSDGVSLNDSCICQTECPTKS